MAASLAIFVCSLSALVQTVGASSFLQRQSSQEVSREELQQVMYMAAIANNATSGLLSELQPLFATLPKNEFGKLEPSVVRYALHRYFAQKYGWHVQGLDPGVGSSHNSSMPASMAMSRVPHYIQGLFEQELSNQGLGLHELAVFAGTLADLIRREAALDLEDIFDAVNLPIDDDLPAKAMDKVLTTYLVTYIKGVHAEGKGSTEKELAYMEKEVEDEVIVWPWAKTWVADLRRAVDLQHHSRRNPFIDAYSFEEVVEAAQEIGHHFGSFQNMECTSLKQRLVEMEDDGTGRVPLTKFYGGMSDPDWPFHESVQFLRSLGALEESDPRRPRVIIPNYMSSRTHCVTPSGLYAVCCIDECEALLSQVERSIAKPVASPSRIVEVVSHLSSDTVQAPRNLTMPQLYRLQEIADFHNGQVPLHGRLFAQWLHHVYPRECRFPHAAGTVDQKSGEEFTLHTGLDREVTAEEIEQLVNLAEPEMRTLTEEAKAASLPWIVSEELVASHTESTSMALVSRVLVLVVALASAAVPALRASKSAIAMHGTKPDKYLV